MTGRNAVRNGEYLIYPCVILHSDDLNATHTKLESSKLETYGSMNNNNRYPGKGDCPSTQRAVNPEAEDEPWLSGPFPLENYYYPDFAENNCGHGRDYPGEYVTSYSTKFKCILFWLSQTHFLLSHIFLHCLLCSLDGYKWL